MLNISPLAVQRPRLGYLYQPLIISPSNGKQAISYTVSRLRNLTLTPAIYTSDGAAKPGATTTVQQRLAVFRHFGAITQNDYLIVDEGKYRIKSVTQQGNGYISALLVSSNDDRFYLSKVEEYRANTPLDVHTSVALDNLIRSINPTTGLLWPLVGSATALYLWPTGSSSAIACTGDYKEKGVVGGIHIQATTIPLYSFPTGYDYGTSHVTVSFKDTLDLSFGDLRITVSDSTLTVAPFGYTTTVLDGYNTVSVDSASGTNIIAVNGVIAHNSTSSYAGDINEMLVLGESHLCSVYLSDSVGVFSALINNHFRTFNQFLGRV